MIGLSVVRSIVCVFLFAAIFMGLPVYAEDTPEIAAMRSKAEKGDAEAQCKLGSCYYLGEGVSKDLSQAVDWYSKAAVQSYAEAQRKLGVCYAKGEGVAKDMKQAAEWFRKAAEQGDAKAQFNLGLVYAQGDGVPKDMKQAAEWFRKAAEQGDAQAQFNLGLVYTQGDGAKKDTKQAAEWFRKAAEQGDAKAQFNLGMFYAKGDGVPKDMKQAVEWWRKAAEQGDPKAQRCLGLSYAKGDGVPKDMKQAVEWWCKAAERGDPRAQFNLGSCYAEGDGVPRDIKQALEWWRKAAELGDPKAQICLGASYAKGDGVPKDPVRGYMWFNIAAAQGEEAATKNRSVVEQEMTPDQIAQAQRLSAAFSPKSPDKEGNSPPSDKTTTIIPGNLVGSGTGFFVTTDGWLVTNAHVVKTGSKAMVKLNDILIPAVVKQTDAANDLALLKVEGQFDALAVERARTVSLGTSVFTVGFPNPGLQGFSPKMTKGEISSLAGIKDDPRFFQVSVPIQPGNSGGALTDPSGNVVGVVTSKISDVAAIETSGAIPQNVNYAIKSTYLLALVESIPEVAKGLKEPVKTQDFTTAVQAVEKASAMVLMFE